MPNEKFLEALKNPVVTWKHPEKGDVKAFNEDLPLARFQVEFDNPGTRSVRAYVYTPRLQAHSMGVEDDATNAADLEFLTKNLYGSQEVMKQYMTGVTKDAEYSKARVAVFTERWNNGSPFSSFMVTKNDTDEQVGMFNIGGSGTPTVAEFAAVSTPEHWANGYGTEVGMLLYKYPQAIKDNGFKMLDGSELEAITATARPDNPSHRVMERLGLTEIGQEEKYGAPRSIYKNTLLELAEVVQNTRERAKLRG